MQSITPYKSSYDIFSCFLHPQNDRPAKLHLDTNNTTKLSVYTTTNSRYSVQPRCESSPEGSPHEHVTLIESQLANDKKVHIFASKLSSKDHKQENALSYTYKTPTSYLYSPQINGQDHKEKIPRQQLKALKNPLADGLTVSFSMQASSSPNQHADYKVQDVKVKKECILSRFATVGNKKKEVFEYPEDSERGNLLTHGMNTSVVSSSVDANGFIPHYQEPPSYIKVCARYKKHKKFKHIFLAQELSNSAKNFYGESISHVDFENSSQSLHNPNEVSKYNGATWALEFSHDGMYLAAAGRGQTIRVWVVLATPKERQEHEYKVKSSEICDDGQLNAHVFSTEPIRNYVGHTGDVVDINWSKNNFLLSSSMDKMVKLWHPSRPECLCTFELDDLVTSIKFHPKDDRFFLTGSLGRILGFWSIPEKKVVYSAESPDSITAVAFTPDGMTAISGSSSGLCRFYDIDQNHGLRFNDQIDVRSSRKNITKGNKITGIRTASFPDDHPYAGEVNILVTSNDSRIRLYRLKDKQLQMKYQGHQNTHSQISANFSDDGRFVICGSEDRKAYIWSIKPEDSDSKETPPVEMFCAHSSIVTTAILAPVTTRQLLSRSGDPIYDICNPRPVTLLSLNEHESEQLTSFKASNKSVMVLEETKESPAYLTRNSHDDGLIVLTSDLTGSIRCFRIDCAFGKRRQWDCSSTISKKKSSNHCSNSVLTQTSNSSSNNSIDRFSITPCSIGLSSRCCENIHNYCVKTTHECPRNSSCKRNTSPGNPFEKRNQSSIISTPQVMVNNMIEKRPSVPLLKTTSAAVKKSSDTCSDQSDDPLMTDSSAQISVQPNKNSQHHFLTEKSNAFWKMPIGCPLSSSSNHDLENGNSQKTNSTKKDESHNIENKIAKASRTERENQNDAPALGGEQVFCIMCEGKEFRARRVQEKSLVMICVRCGVIIG